ncbi:glycerate kinase [Arthrobacter sp. H14-L1]|uniref:glycerate kinase n=1 Tax=Arthrobacter sp. H14-L1 TaxID=2996697 RepID=UPI00226EAE9F|nr:glycerate kinase [Arthrobacter sp. H14-L1]MCY0906665.1 glycerate kinase [Arthrobacter sp. H14-L1]
MRILIAPDKFKGTLTAAEAAAAMAEGVLRVYPEATVTTLPMADGGEGTLEAALAAGYEERLNAVVGPILKPVGAAWAIKGTTAVIETAQASGYLLCEPTRENALRAHSYGCGQLIAAALDAGATDIILGLGGSAMSDAGTGALRALGLQLLDVRGNLVPLGGGSLGEVATIDATGLDPRLAAARIRLAVDVDNVLCGPNGAAYVFAPQKGADPQAVEMLDAGLRNLASVIRSATGTEIDVPGAGAAGGFPSSFLAYARADIEGGFALVAELTSLAGALAQADLVITGEGSLDVQSLSGKAPIGVADAANARGLPVVVVAGRIEVTPAQLAEHGVVAAASAAEVARSGEEAQLHAARYVALATAEALNGV